MSWWEIYIVLSFLTGAVALGGAMIWIGTLQGEEDLR